MSHPAVPAARLGRRPRVRRDSRLTARRLRLLVGAVVTAAALAWALRPLAVGVEHRLAQVLVTAVPPEAWDPSLFL